MNSDSYLNSRPEQGRPVLGTYRGGPHKHVGLGLPNAYLNAQPADSKRIGFRKNVTCQILKPANPVAKCKRKGDGS